MTCSFCGGWLYAIGQLGRLIWMRCRSCGIDHSIPGPRVES